MNKYLVREEVAHEKAPELATYPELVRHLLFHRGLVTKKDAELFLNPDYDSGVHDPFLLKDMDKAVGRILRAIADGERTIIYCDYDCDGLPAGVVMHDFFKKIGYTNFENYFPHRFEEGYGLHVAAIEGFAKSGASLVITFDCGTSDVAAVERANELGLDVIITDHHLSQDAKLPPAFAIVNPKQKDCTYPYNMLCGSGLAYKLVQAILQKKDFGMKPGLEKWFLDMVGLATIADMVPLRDENRIFAYYGLHVLRKTPRLGLRMLLEKAKVRREHLNEEDIGFTLAPRINAASRMGKPSEAFELLTSFEEHHADTMSTYLNRINDERKGATAAITKEVKKMLLSRENVGEPKRVLVIGNPKWKPALIGPVCNNIMDDYGVPVFMWGRADGDHIKGSCRSDGSVSVVDLMRHVPEGIFIGYGGHKMSGGFSVSHEKIHLLDDALNAAYTTCKGTEPPADKEIMVDRRLLLEDVNWSTYHTLEKLAPFGIENPRPVFLFEGVYLAAVKLFGKEKNHLEILLEKSDGRRMPAIGFFMTPESFAAPLKEGIRINLVASIEKSTFKSYPELRLRIIDII